VANLEDAVGTDYHPYWEGASEADLQAIGYPHLRSLRHVFSEISGDKSIWEKYGKDVGELDCLLNPDPKKYTPRRPATIFIWMEPDRLLRAIDSLIEGTKKRDPVLRVLAEVFSEEGEDPDWVYLLESLDGLANCIRHAKRLGAGPITFELF